MFSEERRVGKGSSRYRPEKLPNYNTAGSFYHHKGLLGKSERYFARGVEKFCCLSIQVLLWADLCWQNNSTPFRENSSVLKPVKGDFAFTKHLKASPSCISDQLQQTGFTILAQARSRFPGLPRLCVLKKTTSALWHCSSAPGSLNI